MTVNDMQIIHFKLNPLSFQYSRYLQNTKMSATPLSTRQLVEFGLQVARGISHLHSLGILHKDIAARNCV